MQFNAIIVREEKRREEKRREEKRREEKRREEKRREEKRNSDCLLVFGTNKYFRRRIRYPCAFLLCTRISFVV